MEHSRAGWWSRCGAWQVRQKVRAGINDATRAGLWHSSQPVCAARLWAGGVSARLWHWAQSLTSVWCWSWQAVQLRTLSGGATAGGR